MGEEKKKKKKKNVRDEHAHGNVALAGTAGTSAEVRRVVGGLGGKGGQPDDGVNGVDRHHGVRLGEAAGAGPSRGADQVYPGGDGEEELKVESRKRNLCVSPDCP
jgi:hypothetical protein